MESQAIIQNCYSNLERLLPSMDVICGRLYTKKIINDRQKDAIDAHPVNSMQARFLLDKVLPTKSLSGLEDCCSVLERSAKEDGIDAHGEAAKILREEIKKAKIKHSKQAPPQTQPQQHDNGLEKERSKEKVEVSDPTPGSGQPSSTASQDTSPSDELNAKTMSDSTPRSEQPSSTASQDPPSPSDELNAKTIYRFAIMVANENELHAAMHFLGGSSSEWSKVTTYVDSYTCKGGNKLKSTLSVKIGTKMFGNYRPIKVGRIPGVVVKCEAGSFTQFGSHYTTLQLMQDATKNSWKLKMIFIVGCCGADDKNEVKDKDKENDKDKDKDKDKESGQPERGKNIPVGTVLIAHEIFQYAMGKLYDDEPEWQPKACVSYSSANLRNARRVDDALGIVESINATFLSGDFVIKSANTASKLAELHKGRKYVGFEMEGVGVIKAIFDAKIFVPKCVQPEVVLVKGVSDKAGQDKNEPCTIHFFSDEPLPDVEEDSRQQMCTIKSLALVLQYIVQYKATLNE